MITSLSHSRSRSLQPLNLSQSPLLFPPEVVTSVAEPPLIAAALFPKLTVLPDASVTAASAVSVLVFPNESNYGLFVHTASVNASKFKPFVCHGL